MSSAVNEEAADLRARLDEANRAICSLRTQLAEALKERDWARGRLDAAARAESQLATYKAMFKGTLDRLVEVTDERDAARAAAKAGVE